MTDIKVWENRKDALLKHLSSLHTIAQGQMFPARRETIMLLLEQLNTFAPRYFDFFTNGFSENPQSGIGPGFSPSKDFQQDYVLRQVVNRLAIDLQVLERIIVERLLTPQYDTLLRADSLAYEALKPAKQMGLIDDDTTAITYFEKTANIRVIPYARVALVGIPMSSTKHPQDLLAIPHEIGHYVYWNGKFPSGEVRFVPPNSAVPPQRVHKLLDDYKAKKSVWLKNWIEEIFADVYGALVSGAIGARSLQDVESEASNTQFIEDDFEHPTPLIRPLIYNRVIQYRYWDAPPPNDDDAALAALLANETKPAPHLKALTTKWQATVDKHHMGIAALTVRTSKARNTDLTINSIKAQMLDAVDDMLKLPQLFGGQLRQWLQDDARGKTAKWPALLPNDSDLVNAMTQTEDTLKAFPPQNLENLVLPTSNVDLWDTWKGQYDLSADPVDEAEWLKVLRSEAWTTEGPHGRDRDGG
ncbi:MAG: hypothetical protein H7175_19370 [Burkholderiales bacterium]|nr:hypothetical protein [Anaerolineae bacterium]